MLPHHICPEPNVPDDRGHSSGYADGIASHQSVRARRAKLCVLRPPKACRVLDKAARHQRHIFAILIPGRT